MPGGADPTFVGFLVLALGAVGGFAAYLIRDTIADARKQRDHSLELLEASHQMVRDLTTALRERNDLEERLVKAKS